MQTRSTTDFLTVRGHPMEEGCLSFRGALQVLSGKASEDHPRFHQLV